MQLGDRYVEVRSVLDKLGVEIQMQAGEWLVGICPLHEDAHRSFACNEENGGWICYAGCGKGGLVQLVARVANLSEDEARRRLSEEGELVSTDRLLEFLTRSKRTEEAVDPADLLYEHGRTHGYLLGRGFTLATLKEWGVGWDSVAKAVVVPALTDGKVVGLIKRLVDPQPWQQKYDYTPRWKKSRYVFGLDRCEGDTVILVEGALDALWLHQHGLPGAAILGGKLSDAQRDLVLKKARRVMLAFDNDDIGLKARFDCERVFASRGIGVEHVLVPEQYHDVQECPAEVLFDIMTVTHDALGAV